MHASLIVDTAAVAANYRSLQAMAPNARCAAVIKADAYGLGAIPLAHCLMDTGCKEFFVATCEEGVLLRQGLKSTPQPLPPNNIPIIYVLHGVCRSEIDTFREHQLIPVLNSHEQLALWRTEAQRQQKSLPCILHFDTGLHRLGFDDAEVEKLIESPTSMEGLDIRVIMSHLACSDDPLQEKNRIQRARFEKHIKRLPKTEYSIANSSGIYLGSDYHYDILRPGAALYGVNPTPDDENPIRQVITLQAPVLQTRHIKSGESIGYGITYTANAPHRIATLAIGYADGILRCSGNVAHAYFEQYTLPIIGRVSMDLIMVDITETPEGLIHTDSLITFVDANHTVGELARASDTIGYEILTRLGRRYTREYR